jgi:hypothetical protein
MKKLAIKAFWLFTLGLLSLWWLITLGQWSTTPSWFGDSSAAVIAGIADGTEQWGRLIDVIKSFINWMLGMLSLIALVILIRGGFQMVTAAGDENKYKKGFKILQQAAIGLVFIWVSWLVVSVIFWLLTTIGV